MNTAMNKEYKTKHRLLFDMNRTDPKGCEQGRDHRTVCQSSTESGLTGYCAMGWLETPPTCHELAGNAAESSGSQIVCVEERRDQHYLALKRSENGKVEFVF